VPSLEAAWRLLQVSAVALATISATD
jgi:hypothetical protein